MIPPRSRTCKYPGCKKWGVRRDKKGSLYCINHHHEMIAPLGAAKEEHSGVQTLSEVTEEPKLKVFHKGDNITNCDNLILFSKTLGGCIIIHRDGHVFLPERAIIDPNVPINAAVNLVILP